MSIFMVIALGLLTIFVLMRFRIPIGVAILAGGMMMWALEGAQWAHLPNALNRMITAPRTWDLILALYFVMCLEIELRKSGTLQGMVRSLYQIFVSRKLTMATMPAFLGLLPSLGGARFSAPIVEEIAKGSNISGDDKAAINYWFRHVCEFMSPIIPGIMLACAVAQIPIAELVLHLFWMGVVAFVAGWWVLVRPLPDMPMQKIDMGDVVPLNKTKELFLSLGPVILNVILMLVFNVSASISMGIVTFLTFFALWRAKRYVSWKDIVVGAVDTKLFINITCILFFVSLLRETAILGAVVESMQTSSLPLPFLIASVAFLTGVLTGMSQGHAAMVMPLVAAISPGDLVLGGIVMVFGVLGQMVTPTHICFMITVEYFKANFFAVLRKMLMLVTILGVVYSIVTYLRFYM